MHNRFSEKRTLTMKYYRFLFYNLTLIWKRKKDEVENASINGIISISFLTILNVLSILLIIMTIFGRTSISIPEIENKWITFLIVIAYGILNYFILMHKGKHKKHFERFDNLSDREKKIGMIVTISYSIISILIPLYIFLFTTPSV